VPLTAYHAASEKLVESFSLSADQWALMKREGPGAYLMRRSGAPAILKQNRRGTRWFAHAPGTRDPNWEPESAEHIAAKIAIVTGLREAGFEAWPEGEGASPDGARWEADVLCKAGDRMIAFEVQLSQQTMENYEQRSDRYARSGVKVVWLINHAHVRTFSIDCLYTLGWTGRGPIPASWHLPAIPAFPLDVRKCKEGGPKAELMFVTVWPDMGGGGAYAHVSLQQFACGVAGGALRYAKAKQSWCWDLRRTGSVPIVET
jgi:hypothetical protein